MIVDGIISKIGKSGFVMQCKKPEQDSCVLVKYKGGEFCVGDSVCVEGCIYKCRFLKKDWTYGIIDVIEADSTRLS